MQMSFPKNSSNGAKGTDLRREGRFFKFKKNIIKGVRENESC